MEAVSVIQPAAIIALIAALVQGVKQIPVVADNKRWCPTISLVFGLFAGILAGVFLSGETELPTMIFNGITYGLSACGLYSSINQFTNK